MRLYIICISCFLFTNLAIAIEKDDTYSAHLPILSSQKLSEILPSRFSSKITLKFPYTINELEEIYSTLQIHNYSRVQTLQTLKTMDKYQNNSLSKIYLVTTVNRILQKHINNIYSTEDKISLINTISYNKKTDLDFIKKIIIQTNFDYRRTSDIAFQVFGSYANMDHFITITNAYEKDLDTLFATFAHGYA